MRQRERKIKKKNEDKYYKSMERVKEREEKRKK